SRRAGTRPTGWRHTSPTCGDAPAWRTPRSGDGDPGRHATPRVGVAARTRLKFSSGTGNPPAGGHAGVAQLVARHLAKVKVAGSSPVARSERGRRGYRGLRPRWGGREARQRPAKPCTRVQIPSPPPPSRSG